MSIKFKLLFDTSVHPEPATRGSSGYDCHAHLEHEDTPIHAGDTLRVPLGFSIKLPYGYEGQIRSRSGLALNKQLIVLNAPGTIDSDYEGEVCAIIHNAGRYTQHIKNGDRVCQLVISKIEPPAWTWMNGEQTRGSGGFGSTGG